MYFRTKSENSRQTSDYQIVPRFFVSNPIGLRGNGIRPKFVSDCIDTDGIVRNLGMSFVIHLKN